jgi:poly-gamma-glutamate capsule biosynthesis protein CapA/YwtB (metallophosphatase superfamily)
MLGLRRGWTIVGGTLLVAVGIGAVSAAASADDSDEAIGAATATAAAVRVQPPQRTFTVAATGDVLTESAVIVAAAGAATPGVRYDFTPVFSAVAPVLGAADLAICHMEIPITPPGGRIGVYGHSPFGGNLIAAPFEVAAGLRAAGYDRCSTASNHSNDLGPAGIDSTLDALDDAGLGHNGTARTPAETEPDVFVVDGVRVAHLSYSTFSNTVVPADPWRFHYATDPAAVVADVARARADGAQVVIVSVHISQEMLPAPIQSDRDFITAITRDAHIDLVIEHGPHVIQPVEQVNGTWVFWSVGNFVSGMGWNVTGRYSDPRTLDGLLAWARFTETPSGGFSVEPTAILICDEHTSRTVYPVMRTLADPTISPALRSQLEQCIARSAAVVPDLS